MIQTIYRRVSRIGRQVDKNYRRRQREIRRLRSLPRFEQGQTSLLGLPLRFPDAASTLSAYQSIFLGEIYAFRSSRSRPTIIDCGANIGLGVIFWKSCYPDAEISAFEPDPHIFEMLRWNCDIRKYDGIQLHNEAVWTENRTLEFWNQGADGGHLVDGIATRPIETIDVPAVRLREHLDRKVDLLKLDVEGAETELILDCSDMLTNVDFLFVEYHSFIGQEQRLDEILGVIKSAGFRYHLQPELVARRPFLERPESNGKDNRLNIFGFRP